VKDAAARLTPLGVMVLALLREGDMHPYEMIRLMRHRHDDRIVSVTNGTMYHTVARLERQGLIAEVGIDRDGNRPERTTYALTDAGGEPSSNGCAASCRCSTTRSSSASRSPRRTTSSAMTSGAPAHAARRARGRATTTAAAVRRWPQDPEQYLIEVDRQCAADRRP
jgi:DNA-binding HxlR family transcriptional regulator